MKIDRLIGILTLLLRHEKLTAPQLAERFEVSRRTIGRDIETICRAGIPIVTEQGRGGGVSIAGGYRLNASLLTRDDLRAVLAGLKGIDSVSQISYTQRLTERLPLDRQAAVSAGDTMVIDLASRYQDSLTQKLAMIQEAVKKGCEITFRYYYERGRRIARLSRIWRSFGGPRGICMHFVSSGRIFVFSSSTGFGGFK